MTSNTSDKDNRQAFQAYSSPNSLPISGPIDINIRTDDRTGQRVVLWKDLQLIFENAKYILNDGAAVSFLTDDNFEDLIPLRICCQPGVTLKVIVESKDHTNEARPSVTAVNGSSSPTAISLETKSEISADMAAEFKPELVRDVAGNLAGQDIPTKVPPLNSASLTLPQFMPTGKELASPTQFKEPKSPLHFQLFEGSQDPYFQAIISSQMQVATMMGERFDRLQVANDKILALQEQLIRVQEEKSEMQQRMREEQQQMRKELMGKLLENQEQALDRLALIQNRVQTVVTQTYELHEYPIPRLFIILPREKRKRDKLGKPFAKLFRLFFLCECGIHTKMEGSKMSHEIHLAKHDGYDIQRPDEFFEKYGPYVLTMLQMVKYGFIAAGIAVPVLGHLKFLDGIDSIQEHLDFSKMAIGGLVDDSITFIQDQGTDTSEGLKTTASQMELESQEVLEGADLRQLQSYLSINDKSRVLGNLYRIVTSDGHVKWVCMDHYHDIYQKSALMELQEIVEANKGTFIEEEGKIKIELKSNTLAKQFYDAMIKAHCIQELAITLRWDPTWDDLKTLSTSVTKANVVRLDLSGCDSVVIDYNSNNPEDFNHSRFEPVLQMMSNGRIQSMNLQIRNDDFAHVNIFAMKAAANLRVLSFYGLSVIKTGQTMIGGILEHCRSLTSLSVKSGQGHYTFMYIYRNASLFRNLKTFTADDSDYSAVMGLSKGNIETLEVQKFMLSELNNSDMQEFILGGHLTTLALTLQGSQTDKDRYTDILQHNPKLSKVSFTCWKNYYADVAEWTVSARQDFLDRGQPTSLCKLERWSGTTGASVNFSVDFDDKSSEFDMSTQIILRSRSDINDGLLKLFRQYGWSITGLDSDLYSDSLDDITLLLDTSTESAGSKLESLKVSLGTLSLDGLERMDRIIARSLSLKEPYFTLRLDDQGWEGKVARLSDNHLKKLKELCLEGTVWTPKIANLFPMRSHLPELEKFDLRSSAPKEYPESFAAWIACIVCKPPPQQPDAPVLSSETPSTDQITLRSSQQPDSWAHLKNLTLSCVIMPDQQWSVIFVSIDFTALEELDLQHTKFHLERFQALEDSVPKRNEHEVGLPLKKLLFNCRHESCVYCQPFEGQNEILKALHEKAPVVEVNPYSPGY
ncbi:hypothetical protein BGZ58_008978 [Dissophora ornata]|nr:hypothetical protein BGZ58_008978 [Dissophora ornata]